MRRAAGRARQRILAAMLLAAAASAAAAATASAQELAIPYLDAAPTLEAFVSMTPADDLRARMAVVTGFTQRTPTDGAPASQRTDVYLGYDSRNLYAVFLAFDAEPERVRANLSPRENVDNDDRVGLLIDTFNDQRTAYGFRATPLGVQWDGRWSEVSKGASYDSAYEAVWYTDAALTEQGYVVLMTIPFRTMRFPETGEQRWRVQLERLIPRLSEESYWPAYSQSIDGRLNQAASMSGVRDVSPGRNIQLIPFAFARSYDVLDPDLPGGAAFRDDGEEDLGLDAKFVLRDSLVLDLTYNPDFSQVESDEPQVTVNQRFEVQFPERRPFFIENADYFTTETPLVFTRRIVDPQAGLKFTGRQGPWGIGTMLMDDEAAGANRSVGDPLREASADIGIFRLYRDISEQSRVGVLFTERELGAGYNRVSAVDGRVRLSQNWSTEMLFVNTDTVDQAGELTTGRQTNIRFDRNGRHALVHAHATRQSDAFQADLGFLGRNYQPDTKGMHSRVEFQFWPEGTWVDRWGPRAFVSHYEDYAGVRTYAEISPAMQVSWQGDSQASIGFNKIRERLRPKDYAVLAANRDYERDTWNAAVSTNSLSRFGFSAGVTEGTDINLVPPAGVEPELANLLQTELEMLWRPMDRLRVDTTYLFTELEDRLGAGRIFTNRILRSRWNYQFTKELSLRVIAQQEETDGNPSLTRLEDGKNRNLDVLLRYVLNPWSALYVGFNTNSSNFQLVDTEEGTELVRTDDLHRDGKQLFVKFSYLLQP
jgi:opacity protein-like surface antigen